MQNQPVVRRSELTCPAHSLKMMRKAAASAADEVILDLEDGCAVSQKFAARQTLIAALQALDFGSKVVAIRPNGVHTSYHYRDMIEVLEAAGQHVDVVVLPKVESAEDVLFVDRLLTQIEQHMGFEVGRIKLEVLIESAKAVLDAERIAACSPRMASLIFGLADYAGDIGARSTDDQWAAFHYPKHKLVVAARAAGIDAIDCVTFAFRDEAQCRHDAERAAHMGFDGKWVIHPDQIPLVNTAFLPTQPEIERAQRIISAYEQADVQQGRGAIVVDDEMIDAASLRVEAKKLALARRAGMLE